MASDEDSIELLIRITKAKPHVNDEGVVQIGAVEAQICDQYGRILRPVAKMWGKLGPWLAGRVPAFHCAGEAESDDADVVMWESSLEADKEYLVLVVEAGYADDGGW